MSRVMHKWNGTQRDLPRRPETGFRDGKPAPMERFTTPPPSAEIHENSDTMPRGISDFETDRDGNGGGTYSFRKKRITFQPKISSNFHENYARSMRLFF